jgi:hypothetical protein
MGSRAVNRSQGRDLGWAIAEGAGAVSKEHNDRLLVENQRLAATADEPLVTVTKVPELTDLPLVSAQAADLMAQDTPTDELAVQVTGVNLQTTETGVEVKLQTAPGQTLQPVTRVEGNTLDDYYFDPDNSTVPPLDLFNPVYGGFPIPDRSQLTFDPFRLERNTIGIYLQDQITLLPNLKLLLGGRYDFSDRKNTASARRFASCEVVTSMPACLNANAISGSTFSSR